MSQHHFTFPHSNLPCSKLSVRQDCWMRPLPRRPQKPPKVELQTVPRARVYYVRGGFHPENCTGCFSGPDRVNSSSCALPAGEACIYVCAHTSVRVCVFTVLVRVYVRAYKSVCLCVCVCAVGVELMEKVTLNPVWVIIYCRPFTKKCMAD